jgi:soluble P-type ATPase
MIKVDFPGQESVLLEHLVVDYNGTLAIDGNVIEGVKELLNELSEKIKIYVVTADTFGKAKENLRDVNCKVVILTSTMESIEKGNYIESLDEKSVITIVNGRNDLLLLKEAAIGIAVIQKEGASLKSLMNADIVCTSIIDALELIKYPLRITATLRK